MTRNERILQILYNKMRSEGFVYSFKHYSIINTTWDGFQDIKPKFLVQIDTFNVVHNNSLAVIHPYKIGNETY